ncbi:peptidase M14 [Polaribacter pacificus]|uniref:Peptidase M14 n=1 Tax=Polaribacter pacificus TaxID=1775173 RepID=A0A917MEC8_9FLAO|nr:M14 family metallopeptidase [Polaribacter pacificus]GGH02283.1 peptidase M14 [Polaribacter pacificus]
MKQTIYLFFLTALLCIPVSAQKIQTPSEFLGYELGSRFTRHHKVVDYFQYVASQSNKVKFQVYGETNELRTLSVSFVSSEKNIQNLETIRKQHLSNAGLEKMTELNDISIVWLSYNVHGNEASSTEAAMLTLYKLITENSNLLEKTVVIMDPSINPDGRDRYVNWYNQAAGNPYNNNSNAREHNEPWPGGRPNHYLFDLNRDWAWATQIETQSRLKVYNKWLPHIHVDFHEQGINNPYYFAPAVEPYHEVITDWQRDFQTQIGKNNAKYFDKNGWYYFTKESFDLLYPSYGDTYPTYNGAIGMTYEQAGHGMAGLGIVKADGEELTLWDRLIHHTTTGISTVEMAANNAVKLNTEFKKYFKDGDFTYKSYVMQGTKSKKDKLIALLDKHEIRYGYSKTQSVSGFDYEANKKGSMRATNNDLVVSTNQPKGKLVKALFEPAAKLSDSITYDITAWSVPYAYGLKTIASEKLVGIKAKGKMPMVNPMNRNAYAYTFSWNHVSDGTMLAALLQKNFRVRFTNKDMVNSGKQLPKGSLIITRGDNKHIVNFDQVLTQLANAHDKKTETIATGFSQSGPDMGSSEVKEIKNQKIAIIAGSAASSLSFGEIQYFFEQELKYPYTAINSDDFSTSMLDNYHTLILPNGSYGSVFGKSQLEALKSWVRKGGKVIAIGNANRLFAGQSGFGLTSKSGRDSKDDDKADLDEHFIKYDEKERERIQSSITGAIFKTVVDNTHPLAFGYSDSYFSLKLGSTSYKYLKNGNNVVRLKDNQPVSGFAGHKTLDNLTDTLIFGEDSLGRGSVIYMVDNPLFRSFWDNGKLFFVNALFMTKPSMKQL